MIARNRRWRKATVALGVVVSFPFVFDYLAITITVANNRTTTSGHSNNNKSKCLGRRGQNGTWAPAEGYNYDGMTASMPSYTGQVTQYCDGGCPSTKWRWVDADPGCPIDTLTVDGFCQIMQRLRLRRVFFVGDSLGNQMAESLFHLLGYHGPATWEKTLRSYNNTFRCDDSLFEFEVTFARNDHLGNQTARSTKCGDICTPWLNEYGESPYRTLLVLTMGAHVPTPEDYARDFDAAIEAIQRIGRYRDRVVYTTSVPGHEGCRTYSAPFVNISEYDNSPRNQQYNWNYMERFNDYARERLSTLLAENDDHDGLGWTLLDVYPFTVLRPDGHRAPTRRPPDCLHYLNPGPVDWWNHLLYSHLLDLYEEEAVTGGAAHYAWQLT